MDFGDTLRAIRRDMEEQGIDLLLGFHDGAHFIEKPNAHGAERFQVNRTGYGHLAARRPSYARCHAALGRGKSVRKLPGYAQHWNR